jgi:hypothetical protein
MAYWNIENRHYATTRRDRRDPMPVVALTDISVRNPKPVAGKRVTYLDKTVKGFGVRVTENGQMSYVLTYGPNRTRVKLGSRIPRASRLTPTPRSRFSSDSAFGGIGCKFAGNSEPLRGGFRVE